MGPFQTIQRKRRHVRQPIWPRGGKATGAVRSNAAKVVSRFEPMAPQARKELLLNWLSEQRRASFSEYECAIKAILARACKVSVSDMRELFVKSEKEEEMSRAVDESSAALAAKPSQRQLPPYLFACLSERATEANLFTFVKGCILEREEKRKLDREREKEAKRLQEEATRNLTALSQIEMSKAPGGAALLSNTLRKTLGRKLLDELGRFSSASKSHQL